MSLAGKRLDALTPNDLQALIDDVVSESSREIEFKESVGKDDDAKREFLADVSSFANASGGDLLIGVRAENGVATSFVGIEATKVDSEILRLENLMRDGLDPRIPGVRTQEIPTPDEGGFVVVIRVPRSFAAPHMVKFKNLARFFTRNSAGKYQLDVHELRTAFTFADSVNTSLRDFRLERLARINADEMPVALLPNPKIVLHLIPLTAVDPSHQIDSTSLVRQFDQEFRPINTTAWNRRINFDGALAFSSLGEGLAMSYTQVFRNGAIEAVEAFSMRREYLEKEHLIPSLAIEQTLIEALERYLHVMKLMSLSPPYIVGLSLLDVRGLRMGVNQRHFEEEHDIDRDDLVVPETLIEDDSLPAATILKPALDAIWQATGWPGSLNYDQDGVWRAG